VPTAARLVLLGEVCASIAMTALTGDDGIVLEARSLATSVIYARFFGGNILGYVIMSHYQSYSFR
jgi:hypothetical protein